MLVVHVSFHTKHDTDILYLSRNNGMRGLEVKEVGETTLCEMKNDAVEPFMKHTKKAGVIKSKHCVMKKKSWKEKTQNKRVWKEKRTFILQEMQTPRQV